MEISDLEEDAKAFATYHHEIINHQRKYTGEPYINHPASVVEIVRQVPHTVEMLCAAWLHDVVEDTTATLEDVENSFGPEIASLVEMLTDASKPEDGNRAVRKQIDLEHTAKASPDAKTVKLADLIDNSRDILKHDRGFGIVYLKEKKRLLEVLKEGDQTLWQIANDIVIEGLK